MSYYVCKECYSTSDSINCEYCDTECIETDMVFVFTIQLVCECGSHLQKTIEWTTDSLDGILPDLATDRWCPACKKVAPHSVNIVNYKAIADAETYLQRMYYSELKKG